MRVLQIVKTPQRRGAETFAFQLSEELESLGHATAILYLYASGHAPGLPLRPQDRVLGVDRPLLERFPGFQPALLARLLRAIAEFRPDVIQVNGSRTVKYGSLLRRFWRRGVLVSRSIGSPANWAGGQWKRRLYRLLVLSSLDGVIAVSRATLEGLRECYGLSSPAVVVPRGVDPRALQPERPRDEVRRELGAGDETPVLLYLGSLTREKRPDRLLRVFEGVHREVPGAHLWIAGEGPEADAVERQAAELGIAGQVRRLGVVAGVGDLLHAADLMLLTSDTEGTPGAVLEAGAARLSVVATRVGGVAECVEDGRTGRLAEPRDEAKLAAAAVELLRDESRRRELGEAARRLIEERFDLRLVTARHLDFYRRLLGR